MKKIFHVNVRVQVSKKRYDYETSGVAENDVEVIFDEDGQVVGRLDVTALTEVAYIKHRQRVLDRLASQYVVHEEDEEADDGQHEDVDVPF